MGKYILLATSFSKSTEYRWTQTMLHFVNGYRLIFSIYLENSIWSYSLCMALIVFKVNVSFYLARAFWQAKYLEFYSIYLLYHCIVLHIQTNTSIAYATIRSPIQYGPKKWFYVNSRNYNKFHRMDELCPNSVSISRI